MTDSPRVPLALVVDDEPGILETLAATLADQGAECLCTASGAEAVALYAERRPDVVFLDVWLPDRDGLEVLEALMGFDSAAVVVMMSGHGTTATAVKAIKMGAFEYLEKPLGYARIAEILGAAVGHRRARAGAHDAAGAELALFPDTRERRLPAPPLLEIARASAVPQRTIARATVVYGLGLHSGGRTGMVLQPLPPDCGIHFLSLPSGITIPAHVAAVGDTEYATTLVRDTAAVRTVEHLLSALHAAGVTNLLVKLHAEVPVLDGSAAEFCRLLHEIGLVEQDRPRREIVIDRRYEVGNGAGKLLAVEPAEVLTVAYELRYPPPIGEQRCEIVLDSFARFEREIAPARTFGFMRDLKMMNELGLGSGGRLDNFILVGEDNVINTELRFPDEFVRHKVLDLVGDLYLLGYPVRGRFTARFTGHRDNVALARQIVAANS